MDQEVQNQMYWLRRVAFIGEPKCYVNEVFFDLDGTVENLPDADRARRFE
jgi:hypothetical protein